MDEWTLRRKSVTIGRTLKQGEDSPHQDALVRHGSDARRIVTPHRIATKSARECVTERAAHSFLS